MVGTIHAAEKLKRATLTAVITRADGTVENLGVISYYHKSPIMRSLWRLRQLFKFKRRP